MAEIKSAVKEIVSLVFLTIVMGLAVWGACDIASNLRQQRPDYNYTVTSR